MRVVWLRAVIHSRAPPLPFIEEILKPRAQLQQSAANLMGPSSYTARRSLFLKGCHSPRGALPNLQVGGSWGLVKEPAAAFVPLLGLTPWP